MGVSRSAISYILYDFMSVAIRTIRTAVIACAHFPMFQASSVSWLSRFRGYPCYPAYPGYPGFQAIQQCRGCCWGLQLVKCRCYGGILLDVTGGYLFMVVSAKVLAIVAVKLVILLGMGP